MTLGLGSRLAHAIGRARATIVIPALGVLVLAGCGGGGSSTSTGTGAQEPGSGANAQQTVSGITPSSTASHPSTSRVLLGRPPARPYRVPSGREHARPEHAGPAPTSRGHETLEAIGSAASGSEKTQIASAVRRYYAAYTAGDGARACALASKSLVMAIAGQIAKLVVGKVESCAAALSALGKRMAAGKRSELMGLRVTDVRVEGSRGFAFIKSRAIPYGVMPLHREAGVWKVDQYEATTLLPPR